LSVQGKEGWGKKKKLKALKGGSLLCYLCVWAGTKKGQEATQWPLVDRNKQKKEEKEREEGGDINENLPESKKGKEKGTKQKLLPHSGL